MTVPVGLAFVLMGSMTRDHFKKCVLGKSFADVFNESISTLSSSQHRRSVPPHPCPLPQGEGERPRVEKASGASNVMRWTCCSLSLRERAGVRGNGAWVL